jgi:hypothetical protein
VESDVSTDPPPTSSLTTSTLTPSAPYLIHCLLTSLYLLLAHMPSTPPSEPALVTEFPPKVEETKTERLPSIFRLHHRFLLKKNGGRRLVINYPALDYELPAPDEYVSTSFLSEPDEESGREHPEEELPTFTTVDCLTAFCMLSIEQEKKDEGEHSEEEPPEL